MQSLWITGQTGSGKTAQLIEAGLVEPLEQLQQNKQGSVLVFAANSENRSILVDRMMQATQGQVEIRSTTPLAFFEDETLLFWPLLVKALNLKAYLPLRLRPEMEQELATRLWSDELLSGQLSRAGVSPDRMVRQALDILQLAALSSVPLKQVAQILETGFADLALDRSLYPCIQVVFLRWRSWCLERGFLSYGLLAELYGQHLLQQPRYQSHLIQRYSMVLVDDLDEYPAVTRCLFEQFLDQGTPIAFTYNPQGSVRLGLGADPEYLETLQERCQTAIHLDKAVNLAQLVAEPIVELVSQSDQSFLDLSDRAGDLRSIQTLSRADLLRKIAEEIVQQVKSGAIQPQEIAILGPGLDAIARYTLREILAYEGIEIESIREQRPLVSSPVIRALLTVLTLVYPGLGHLVDRDAVAELLVVLSQAATFTIDPVRAGLLADHCFLPDSDNPCLLSVQAFPRWDRLGHQATQAYEQILRWFEIQRSQQQQRLLPSPIVLLDRAIQQFFVSRQLLGFDQMRVLREFIETAMHYWEVESRLQPQGSEFYTETIRQFIQLQSRGIITADHYPESPLSTPNPDVTMA
ncbi:MAG: recombinase family protein, partial [Microcoleaceae cyanobacterium]